MKIKKRPLLAAFCIPAAIMCAVIIYKEIYPFGEQCFLRVDLYNQYMPFFSELHRKLREGGSLFFSWRAGLGEDFFALYAYYLASPMNWLLILCPQEFLIEFMTLLIVIKIGLCGSSFAWYLQKHFNNNSYETTFFAVFYALSGYLCAYNWNIMWLDCVILAPVVIWGLEELLYAERAGLYTLSLAACICTNYYISMPVCIFLCLYFGVLLIFVPGKARLGSMLRFAYSSLLAAGMSALLLIPTVLALRSSGFSHTNFPTKIKFYFNIIEVLARHCIQVAVELRDGHWPNVYCGAAIFLLLPLYVCCRQIAWKEKTAKLLLLVFLYLSFSVNVLDFFWHGMNYPNSLPARQSFLAVFLLLTLGFEAFTHYGEISEGVLCFCAGIALLFLFLCSLFLDGGEVSKRSFGLTMLYVSVFALLFYWYSRKSLKGLPAGILFAVMVILETAVNTEATSVATTNRTEYTKQYETNKALLLEKKKDFVRIEERSRMTKNDGMLGAFPTATYFSSTVSQRVGAFYKRLGMSSSKVFYSHDGAMPLTSALLSVGYTISDRKDEPEEFYELAGEKNGTYLYQNRYVLPLGFGIPKDSCGQLGMEEGLVFDRYNAWAESLGSAEKLFEPLLVSKNGEEITAEAEKGGFLYAYPLSCRQKDITAEINGEEKHFSKVYYPHLLELGFCESGSRIVFRGSGDVRYAGAELELLLYRMNTSVLRQIMSILARDPMQIQEMTDTYVRGSIEMSKDGMLAVSIPALPGWSVRADGQKAEITPFADAMLGVMLEKGRHEIEFCYSPPGFAVGAAISVTSVIIYLALYVRKPLWRKMQALKGRRGKTAVS